jgi:hypothetical protein
MPAEKFLFPQRMVRAYNSPKPGGYLGNVESTNSNEVFVMNIFNKYNSNRHPSSLAFLAEIYISNSRKVLTITVGLMLSLSAAPAWGIYGGVLESELADELKHEYAAMLMTEPFLNDDGKIVMYGVCGASLVNSPEIVEADLYRRIAITARHCVEYRDRMGVTFVEHPGATTGYDGILESDLYMGNVYLPEDGPGYYIPIPDVAIIILDDPVPDTVVQIPAELPFVGEAKNYFRSRPGPDKDLVVTGYGIAGYGNIHSSDIPGADPTGHNPIRGLRDKMTVTSGIQSVTKTFVHVNFNFGDGKGTLCNGDSGSAVVIDGHAGDEIPSIALGVYVDGDYCTTVGWFQRIDTQEFKDFLIDTLESN